MKTKILILGLIYLFVFAYCKSPADPKIEEVLTEPFIQLHIPDIESFSVDYEDDRLQDGLGYLGTAILSWRVSNADTVEIDNGIGEVEAEGVKEVAPTETTTYILTATNKDSTKEASLEVVCLEGNVRQHHVYSFVYLIVDLDDELGISLYAKCYNNGWNAVFNVRVKITLTDGYWTFEIVKEIDVCDRMGPGENVSWYTEIKDPDGELVEAFSSDELAIFTDYEWDN